ncbi:SHOCT domain-containing protein [Neobacillus sp. PS3-12]|jgi:putative membrane protein|uniref:SHOCT domain-containing protein n=1 Tax=Neobacillus sp. PS3-12 TaxID=3070677 RepID=UPI0027DF91A8|nr:SHOCT domain-containing protein [Neobacillus sp. PS3-12]WML54457.1 SHOCT domain-containing protein [Neobacillus sp. PS3-12]
MMGRGFAFGYGTYGCGGLIPMILIIVVLGLLVFLIARRPTRHREHQGSQAISILNERLAKGEITSEEYEKLKKTIQH